MKLAADALHNASSAMTSLHCQVGHRRNIHVHLRSLGRTEGTIEAITLRRRDGGSLSRNTSESNTASETTEQAVTPQSNLTNPASSQEFPRASVLESRLSTSSGLHFLFFPFRPTLSKATGSFLWESFFFSKKNFVVIRLLSFSFHCNGSIHGFFPRPLRHEQRKKPNCVCQR